VNYSYTGKNIVMITFLTLLLVVFGTSHAGSDAETTSFEEVKDDTQELLSSLKDYSADKKDVAVEKSKQALHRLDERIEKLEEGAEQRWSEMSDDARQKSRESLEALRNQRAEVAKWYRSMKESSGESWGHVKSGFSDAYQAMSDTWERVEEEFSESS